jgi:hypothetical protein
MKAILSVQIVGSQKCRFSWKAHSDEKRCSLEALVKKVPNGIFLTSIEAISTVYGYCIVDQICCHYASRFSSTSNGYCLAFFFYTVISSSDETSPDTAS